MKYNYISVDQDRYYTSGVDKYLETATVKTTKKFCNTKIPSDVIFTKDNVSTSDEQFDKLTRESNICYIYCIGSLIY